MQIRFLLWKNVYSCSHIIEDRILSVLFEIAFKKLYVSDLYSKSKMLRAILFSEF